MQAKLIGLAIGLVLLFQCGLAQLEGCNAPADQGNMTWSQSNDKAPITGQITSTLSESSVTAGLATLAILAIAAVALQIHVKKNEVVS